MAGDAFGKLKDSVNRGIATISVKTSSSLEKSKIKMQIDNLEGNIKRDLSSLGETVFAMWRDHGDNNETVEKLCASIQGKRDEIAKLNEELAGIDERDSKILGTQKSAPTAPQPLVCPNCGAEYEVPVRFCRKCGTKISDT